MRTDSTEELSTPTSEADETDPAVVRRTIRGRADDLKRRELQQAVNQLEAHGGLTADQRQILTQMATAIVDGILTAPESTLPGAPAYDKDTVRTAIELFDPNQ